MAADPKNFNADPDLTFHFTADPDPAKLRLQVYRLQTPKGSILSVHASIVSVHGLQGSILSL